VTTLSPTRRGVLWLGLRCDVRCEFCYDDRIPRDQKEWVRFEDITAALDKYAHFYGNEYVDFMGGEPTYHPRIADIVAYASSTGLRPTVVTHGMRLADPKFARRLHDAGLHDVLMSVHAVGETLERIHQRGTNNSERQRRALQNLAELGVPVRFNVTVINRNVDQLSTVAQLAIESGARVVNFLTFNPYFEWRSDVEIPFQVSHTNAARGLIGAIELLTANGVEANVRYFPICMLPGYEQHVFTGHQLPFDTHEWDYNSWYDRGIPGRPPAEWYHGAADEQQERHHYVQPEPCQRCAARAICDGLHEQYLHRFGDGELRPYDGEPITDPTHFIRHQPSLVAEELTVDNVDADPALASALPLTQHDATLNNRAGIKRSYGYVD
jgi:MoaA/NifB/PqqE/SkfB family radical SAM enzyme